MEESYFDIIIREFKASNLNIQTKHVKLGATHAVKTPKDFTTQYSNMSPTERCDLFLYEYQHWIMRPFTGEEIAATKVVTVITQIINESKDAEFKTTLAAALERFKKKYDFKINPMSIMSDAKNTQFNY